MPPQRARRSRATRRRSIVFGTNVLADAMVIIAQREPSAAGLAKLMNVSISTVSRLIAELKKTWDVVSVRTPKGWRYQWRLEDADKVLKHPSSTFVIPKDECHPPRGKAEDEIYDGD